MTKKRFILVIGIFLLSVQNMYAQWSYGMGTGTTWYLGDVSLFEPLNGRGSIGTELWYEVNNLITLKTGGNIYQIAGNDRLRARNRSFRATNIEVYSALMLTLKKPQDRRRGVTQRWYPFSYIGVGITSNDPEGRTTGNGFTSLPSIKPEGQEIPLIAPFLIGGGGIAINISRDFKIVGETGLRVTTTDYLDGVSLSSFTPSSTASGYYTAIGGNVIGGNPTNKDMYLMTSFKLFYTPYDFDFRKKYASRNSRYKRGRVKRRR